MNRTDSKATVNSWNARYGVGTRVRYWLGVREGTVLTGETSSLAELLGGHTPVVWVTGRAGCIALTHVEAINDASNPVSTMPAAESRDGTRTGIGYHVAKIPSGVYGEISKVHEELAELDDAVRQNARIMALVEAADLLGALEAWLGTYAPGFDLNDLRKMSDITKRAFASGERTST